MEKTCNELSSQCEALANKFEDSLDKKIKGLALICSFTTEKTNYLMWAHYSNSHKGYCLEYNFPGPLIEDGFVLPVSYRHSPVDVTNLVRKSGAGVKKILGRAAMGSALVKSHVWDYEDEWRYICFVEKDDRELKGLHLNRVLIGCNASDELTQKVVNICRKKGIKVVKQKRSSNSFDLIDGERLV